MTKPTFSGDELQQLWAAANAVWQYVGDDYLQMVPSGVVKRDEVLEVVCDAGRLEEELGRRGLKHLADRLPHGREIYDLLKPGFRYARYGR